MKANPDTFIPLSILGSQRYEVSVFACLAKQQEQREKLAKEALKKESS